MNVGILSRNGQQGKRNLADLNRALEKRSGAKHGSAIMAILRMSEASDQAEVVNKLHRLFTKALAKYFKGKEAHKVINQGEVLSALSIMAAQCIYKFREIDEPTAQMHEFGELVQRNYTVLSEWDKERTNEPVN